MRVLLIIDVQNDFMPDGALAVPQGDAIIPVINQIQNKFDLVVATQDWHPKNHASFASQYPGKTPLKKLYSAVWNKHFGQIIVCKDLWALNFIPSLKPIL